MTLEEQLEEGLNTAMRSPCLICGAESKVAYVLPDEQPPAPIKLHFYALCSVCTDKPDAEKASEKIVMARKSRPNSGLN